jgi:hypothetical protein
MALRKILSAAVFLTAFTSTAAFAEGSGCATADTPSSSPAPFVCPDVPLVQRRRAPAPEPAPESKVEVKAKSKKAKKAKAKAKAAEAAAPAVEEKK